MSQKLQVIHRKDDKDFVRCLRTGELVNVGIECQKCQFLSIILDINTVKCNWTQEKEDLQNGDKYFELSCGPTGYASTSAQLRRLSR